MMNRMHLVSLFLTFALQINSCSNQANEENDKWRELGGPNKITSVAFFYKKEATYEERKRFEESVLHKPHPEGKGHYLQDGIADLFNLRNSDYEGFGINFSVDATAEERERLKKNIRESPIVYRVYEYVVPSEIKDL